MKLLHYIGFGLNVTNDTPTTCIKSLARPHLKDTSDLLSITRENILAETLNQFEEMHEKMIKEGFTPFLSEYLQNWLHR